VAARYAAATGFDITGLAFYHAFGIYRVAVIIQQIYIRYRRGQTSDERFAALGAVVPLLAEEARRAAL
jgi:aminoglycoside phosphotransferase (APT) family kinase protein